MNSNVFATLKLSTGVELSILDIKAFHVWRANFKMGTQNETLQYEFMAYLLEQILLMDYKPVTLEQIAQMDVEDYLEILNVVNTMVSKLNLPR